MREELISQYIDNELDLDDKIAFVESIHHSRRYKDDTVELLRQEDQLRTLPDNLVPTIAFAGQPGAERTMRNRLGVLSGALAAAALVFFLVWAPATDRTDGGTVPYRFVVYLPGAQNAAITGSFNGWQTLPMKKAGPAGYWEISIDLMPGEYRYSYLLDGGRRIADPTVWIREKDDFGSENSVLEVRT
jgi:hypothetical protein